MPASTASSRTFGPEKGVGGLCSLRLSAMGWAQMNCLNDQTLLGRFKGKPKDVCLNKHASARGWPCEDETNLTPLLVYST